MPEFSGLLVKVRGDGKRFASAAAKAFGARDTVIKPILHVPAKPAEPGFGLSAGEASTWFSVGGSDTDQAHPWDVAHQLLAPGGAFAAATASDVQAIEPNLVQQWLKAPDADAVMKSAQEFCTFDPQDPAGRQAIGPGPGVEFRRRFQPVQRGAAACRQQARGHYHRSSGYRVRPGPHHASGEPRRQDPAAQLRR